MRKRSAATTTLFFWQLLKKSGASWLENKSARLGAALAFYSALSFMPLLLLVISISALIWDRQSAQNHLITQMQDVIGARGADALKTILLSAQNTENGGVIASVVGFALLIFSASGVFGELQDSLNLIWKATPRRGRAFLRLVRDRFFSFSMVVGSGFLLLVSMLLSAWLAAATRYLGDLMPNLIVLIKGADFLVSFGIASFLFALIFKTIPDAPVRWRDAWTGGALTAALFILGKIALEFYLVHATIASTYGVAGSLVVLLLWVYYSAQILFFGAEFTAAYAREKGS